jgi:hypothetical protein
MKYTVEKGSGATIYIYQVNKIWFSLSNFDKGDTHTNTETHGQHCDHTSLLLFFINKERKLKIKVGLGYHHAVCVPVYSPHPLLNA